MNDTRVPAIGDLAAEVAEFLVELVAALNRDMLTNPSQYTEQVLRTIDCQLDNLILNLVDVVDSIREEAPQTAALFCWDD
jgi:hypothetical protein